MKDNRRGKLNTKRLEGTFYDFTGKLFDLIMISVFWIIGSLPVVTMGTSFCAMYEAVYKSVRKDEGTFATVFWKAYRRDMKASIIVWLIYLIAGFLLLLNFGIIRSQDFGYLGLFFMALYIILFFLLIGAACYTFPAISRFDMPAGWYIKLGFYLTFRHFPLTLMLIAIVSCIYLAVYAKPALIMILPGISAWVASYMIAPVLKKHEPKKDDGVDTDDESDT